MRTLKKNKQDLHYANQVGVKPIYQTYIDEDGEEIPVETGDYEAVYGKAFPISGNIAMSGDETKVVEFGIDRSDYDALLVLDLKDAQLSETSLVWHESAVGYTDNAYKNTDAKTADYRVAKKIPSLNQMVYLLKRIQK